MTNKPYGIYADFSELCIACFIICVVWWKVFNRLFEATRRAKGRKTNLHSPTARRFLSSAESQAAGSGAGVIETASPLRTNSTLPIRLIGFVCKSVHYKLIAVNAREISGLWELDLTGEGLACRMSDDFLIYHCLGSEGVRRALLVFECARGFCHSQTQSIQDLSLSTKDLAERTRRGKDGSIEMRAHFLQRRSLPPSLPPSFLPFIRWKWLQGTGHIYGSPFSLPSVLISKRVMVNPTYPSLAHVV